MQCTNREYMNIYLPHSSGIVIAVILVCMTNVLMIFVQMRLMITYFSEVRKKPIWFPKCSQLHRTGRQAVLQYSLVVRWATISLSLLLSAWQAAGLWWVVTLHLHGYNSHNYHNKTYTTPHHHTTITRHRSYTTPTGHYETVRLTLGRLEGLVGGRGQR